MERINGFNLEHNKRYCIELDNDILRQYGACKYKHYGTFINYIRKNNVVYANFKDIKNIKSCKINEEIKEIKEIQHEISGMYWKFYKNKKDELEHKIINQVLQNITGEKNFNFY